MVGRPLYWLVLAVCIMTGSGLCAKADDAQDAKLAPLLQIFVDELVEITPGSGPFPKSFRMGSDSGRDSEQPVHEVTLVNSFEIAKYEVPQNLYEAVMGKNPSRWQGPRNAAEMMTFIEAGQFCEKLTGLLRERNLIKPDEIIRLPTEAEWEYCCRAGTSTNYSFGNEARKPDDAEKKASVLDGYGWHTGNAAGNDPPVGALKSNSWGLYDLHGYLWEFTSDVWRPNYEGAPRDGSVRAGDNKKPAPFSIALRGGSWKSPYTDLRSSSRMAFASDQRDDAVGFRCVKSRTP